MSGSSRGDDPPAGPRVGSEPASEPGSEPGSEPMVVDTSAIVAVLRGEPDAGSYVDALAGANGSKISAGTYLEAAIVVDANGDPVLSGRFDDLLVTARLQVEPVTEHQAEIARKAYRDFGKGSGHPAGLNFGDCFAYALCRATGSLYKGDDFGQTDLRTASS